MSLNFSSHKTHGHKRSSQLKETKKKTDISHPNTLIKLGKKNLIVSAIKILFKIHKMCGILT